MSENTRTCKDCCTPPEVAADASEVTRQGQDLTTYIYASTITAARQVKNPGYQYQFKSQTERLQALMGKITTPEAISLRRNGGQCGQ
jgi:hypothetical protein